MSGGMALRVEPIRWRREFNRELVRMMLYELKKAKADAASLCARMGEQLCNGPGELDSETCVNFSKWLFGWASYHPASHLGASVHSRDSLLSLLPRDFF